MKQSLAALALCCCGIAFGQQPKLDPLAVSVCVEQNDSKTASEVIDALKTFIRASGRYELSSNCSANADFRLMIVAARAAETSASPTETGSAISVAFVGRCLATGGATLVPFFAPNLALEGGRIPYYLGNMALIEPASGSHSDAAARILREMQDTLEGKPNVPKSGK